MMRSRDVLTNMAAITVTCTEDRGRLRGGGGGGGGGRRGGGGGGGASIMSEEVLGL